MPRGPQAPPGNRVRRFIEDVRRSLSRSPSAGAVDAPRDAPSQTSAPQLNNRRRTRPRAPTPPPMELPEPSPIEMSPPVMYPPGPPPSYHSGRGQNRSRSRSSSQGHVPRASNSAGHANESVLVSGRESRLDQHRRHLSEASRMSQVSGGRASVVAPSYHSGTGPPDYHDPLSAPNYNDYPQSDDEIPEPERSDEATLNVLSASGYNFYQNFRRPGEEEDSDDDEDDEDHHHNVLAHQRTRSSQFSDQLDVPDMGSWYDDSNWDERPTSHRSQQSNRSFASSGVLSLNEAVTRGPTRGRGRGNQRLGGSSRGPPLSSSALSIRSVASSGIGSIRELVEEPAQGWGMGGSPTQQRTQQRGGRGRGGSSRPGT